MNYQMKCKCTICFDLMICHGIPDCRKVYAKAHRRTDCYPATPQG